MDMRKNTFFVDSAYDNSLAGIKGAIDLDQDLKVGGQLEVWSTAGITAGNKAVSQLNRSGTGGIEVGIVDAWIENKDFGKIFLGKGNMASKNTAASTLSDVDLVSYAGAADMAGGMYFHVKDNAGRVVYTDPKLGDIFEPINGLGVADRVRYDTPKFKGFNLSTSIGNITEKDENNVVTKMKYCSDLALKYEDTIGDFKLKGSAGIATFSKDSDARNTKMYNGSFALLHINTGLNIDASIGRQTHPNDTVDINGTRENTKNKRKFYYVQLGKQAELVKYGKTNFAIDYWSAKHTLRDNDKAKAYGAGVVQKLKKVNTELYFGIRNYKYERPGTTKYNKILAALFGIKINLEGKL